MNKMITFVHCYKTYTQKTYLSNGDYQHYYFIIKLCIPWGLLENIKSLTANKYYIRNVMQRTVHVSDVLIQIASLFKNNCITPQQNIFGKLHPCERILFPFRNLYFLYTLYQNLHSIDRAYLFFSQNSHKFYLFNIYAPLS